MAKSQARRAESKVQMLLMPRSLREKTPPPSPEEANLNKKPLSFQEISTSHSVLAM